MTRADVPRVTECWRCGARTAGPELRPNEPRIVDTATCAGCRSYVAAPTVGRDAKCPPKFACDPCGRRGFVVAATTMGCGSGYYCGRCADTRVRCRECDRPRDEELDDDRPDRWTVAAEEVDDTGHVAGGII